MTAVQLHFDATSKYLRLAEAKREALVLGRERARHELGVARASRRHGTVGKHLLWFNGRGQNGVGPRRLQTRLVKAVHAELERLLLEWTREGVDGQSVQPAEQRRVCLR